MADQNSGMQNPGTSSIQGPGDQNPKNGGASQEAAFGKRTSSSSNKEQYHANRGGGSGKDRADQNNAKNIQNAAKVASKSANPYAKAAGTAVKVGDKLTGGKVSGAAGKAMTRANQMAPGGRQIQNASNKLSESGASDKIGDAASKKDGGKDSSGSFPMKGKNSPLKPSLGGKKKSDKDNDDDGSDSSKSIQKGLKFSARMFAAVAMPIIFLFLPLLLVILIVVIVVAGVSNQYNDGLGVRTATGGNTGNVAYTPSTGSEEDFDNAVADVKSYFEGQGKEFNELAVAAVAYTLRAHQAATYIDITSPVIEELGDNMLDGNVYSEEQFRNFLTSNFMPRYFRGKSSDEIEILVDEVFDWMEQYKDFVGDKDDSYSGSSGCVNGGVCNYDIIGFSINGVNIPKKMEIKNLKVRLMQCGGAFGNGSDTQPIDQDLVDFEDYVAGVVYGETGIYKQYAEAMKAHMVAARSFALARPIEMAKSTGKKLEQENGQWILQISSCVNDQIFCDINQGCTSMGGSQGGYFASGRVAGGVKYIEPLPQDDVLRTYAKETEGEVLLNSEGYIVEAGYDGTDPESFIELAKKGLNYKEILMQFYNSSKRRYGATDVGKVSCSTDTSNCISSTGDWANWKQIRGPWINKEIGNSGSTIRQIGCLVTSIAIQIARSGVSTVIDDFNPGTFVDFLNQHNGFDSQGNLQYAPINDVSPNFKYVSSMSVAGLSQSSKLSKLKDLLDSGYYVVAEVKGNTGQHWVAVDSINGNSIKMMDPASDSTDMWGQYNSGNTSRYIYFKAS